MLGHGQLCPVVGPALSENIHCKDTRMGTGLAHRSTPHQPGRLAEKAGGEGGEEQLCSRYKVISLNIYLVVRLFYFFLVKEKEKKTSFSFAS